MPVGLFRNSQIYEGFGTNRQRVVKTQNQPSTTASPSSTVLPQAPSVPGSNQNPAPTEDNSKIRDISDGGGIDANSSFDNPKKIRSQSFVLQFRGNNTEEFLAFEGQPQVNISFEVKAKGTNAGVNISFLDKNGNELSSPILIQAINAGTASTSASLSLATKQTVIMKIFSIAYGRETYPGTLKVTFKSGLENSQ